MTKPIETITPSPQYLDLRSLAAYASCSVRWLRDRLVDRSDPLPHFRIAGKLLVNRQEFDRWVSGYRIMAPANGLDEIVESVVAQVRLPNVTGRN